MLTGLLSTAHAANWGDSEANVLRVERASLLDSLVASYYHEVYTSYDEFAHEMILNDSTFISSSRALPDSVYAKRLSMLNSVIQLPYNDVVKNYISVYTNPRGSFKKIMGRAEYYIPMFEEELYRQGLPTELKILPIIESALNPTAVSRMGAAGLWQFMYATGKHYGLKQTSFMDQRMDPRESTKAACRYLKDLYNIYGDWTLALAAYNCGPGNVNKALKRANNPKSYWDIYFLLPRETRGYVPAFIAATYAYTFHKAHDLDIEPVQHPIVTDTVVISNKLLHFKQISSTINVSDETLRALNPCYIKDIVPAKNNPYVLVLPVETMGEFISNEQEIYAKDSLYLKEYKNIANLDLETNRNIIHTVRKGEYLGLIARKYNVSVANLKRWNGIKNEKSLQVGQKLKILR